MRVLFVRTGNTCLHQRFPTLGGEEAPPATRYERIVESLT